MRRNLQTPSCTGSKSMLVKDLESICMSIAGYRDAAVNRDAYPDDVLIVTWAEGSDCHALTSHSSRHAPSRRGLRAVHLCNYLATGSATRAQWTRRHPPHPTRWLACPRRPRAAHRAFVIAGI